MNKTVHVNRIDVVRPAPVSVSEMDHFRKLTGVRKQDIATMTGRKATAPRLATEWTQKGAPAYARPAMREFFRRLVLKEQSAQALVLPGIIDDREQEWEDRCDGEETEAPGDDPRRD